MNLPGIYLDHQATTAADPRVIEVMQPWWGRPANPHAEGHAFGRAARDAVEDARASVASLIGAQSEEIFFTANATEAVNIVIRSQSPGVEVAASAIEHACVLETLADPVLRLKTSTLAVGQDGIVDTEALAGILTPATRLACVMAVNNEIGTIQPIDEIGLLCGDAGVPFFCDLAQAAGKIVIDVQRSGIGFAALSSHKMHGPQGIGALYCRKDLIAQLRPVTTGGGQEGRLRAGTLPTALCAGFGTACDIAAASLEADAGRVRELAAMFLDTIRSAFPDLEVNGSDLERVPHNLNLSIPGVNADALLARLPGVAVSTGSACNSGALEPSHVLAAMGLDAWRSENAVRVGFGRYTTTEETALAARLIVQAATAIRSRQPHRIAVGGR